MSRGFEPLKTVHASGWLLIAVGGISIVAGMLALAYPEMTLLVLGLVAGINVLLLGVQALVDAVTDEDGSGARMLVAVLGVLGVLGGIVMMRRPGETVLRDRDGARALAGPERADGGDHLADRAGRTGSAAAPRRGGLPDRGADPGMA